jgi:hypothetical protein
MGMKDPVIANQWRHTSPLAGTPIQGTKGSNGLYLVTYTTGTPPTTADVFAIGCLVLDVTNGKAYINTGTTDVPSWDSLGDISAGEISLADTKILIGGAGGVAVGKDMSGDATIANTGALTITALAIETGMLAAAAVTNEKMGGPKVGVIQQTVAVAAFDDSGTNAVGFIDLTDLLPAGAIVTQSMLSALTGFAGDTTATIQIGDGSTADRYSTGTPDVFSTAAFISLGVVSGTAYDLAAVTLRVTITGGSDFTAIISDGNGEVTITVFYYTV